MLEETKWIFSECFFQCVIWYHERTCTYFRSSSSECLDLKLYNTTNKLVGNRRWGFWKQSRICQLDVI